MVSLPRLTAEDLAHHRAVASKPLSVEDLRRRRDGEDRDPVSLAPAMLVDAAQMRRISGRAVRLGLDRQLDLRLDLILDSGGVSLVAVQKIFPTGEHYAAEVGPVLRCHALLSVVGTSDAVDAEIDLLLRDYAALTPVAYDPDSVSPLRAQDFNVTAADMLPDAESPTRSVLAETVQSRRGGRS